MKFKFFEFQISSAVKYYYLNLFFKLLRQWFRFSLKPWTTLSNDNNNNNNYRRRIRGNPSKLVGGWIFFLNIQHLWFTLVCLKSRAVENWNFANEKWKSEENRIGFNDFVIENGNNHKHISKHQTNVRKLEKTPSAHSRQGNFHETYEFLVQNESGFRCSASSWSNEKKYYQQSFANDVTNFHHFLLLISQKNQWLFIGWKMVYTFRYEKKNPVAIQCRLQVCRAW